MLVHERLDPVEASLTILRQGQAEGGAFLACPTFPTYRYCWFRDGAFIAQALDLYGEHECARRFYDWGVRTILRYRSVVERVLEGPANAVPPCHLHTRYRPDGSSANEDWPTFQLDGFGAFLWGLVEHGRLSGLPAPAEWREASDLLVDYLAHLWKAPNFDCWEEDPDRIHISTLCAVHGGAAAVAAAFERTKADTLARDIRLFVTAQAAESGHLPKFAGSESVDASLLWATVPFGMLDAHDPIMQETARRIEAELTGASGGVHRYATDTYYGGGEWILLTALLGEYRLRQGRRSDAERALTWIEGQASKSGELPEQVPLDLIAPGCFETWVERWGPVACPLLWSHAAYLCLKAALTRTAQ